MNRYKEIKTYWDNASQDPNVDDKYICDLDTYRCLEELGYLKGKVLEIGCGVGRLLKDGDYGIDISEKMLEIAKERKPNCHYKVTTGDIPYRSNYFDNVFSFLVFQHLKMEEIETYMIEAYRVLKKGGEFKFQFIIGDENEPFSNHYSLEEMRMLMYTAGFETVWNKKSNIHYQWHWIGANK